MPKQSPPLFARELRQKTALAERLFKNQRTRFGEPTFERNQRVLAALRSISPLLPREVQLAALFYQLPKEKRYLLKLDIRKLVNASDELSAASHDKKDFLAALSLKHMPPSAALINMASAITSLENQHVPADEKQRIAQIMLDVHAPLLDILGLYWISARVGNQALPYAYPDHHRKIVSSLLTAERELESILPQIRARVREAADKMGVHYEITSGIKQPFSAFRKLLMTGKPLHAAHLQDAARMRIVIHHSDEKKCYHLAKLLAQDEALSISEKEDYIRNPKPNGYKSLHLNIGPRKVKGKVFKKFELQVRTHEMHVKAEGDAPSQMHYVYKLKYLPAETRRALRKVSQKVDAALEAGWLKTRKFRGNK